MRSLFALFLIVSAAPVVAHSQAASRLPEDPSAAIQTTGSSSQAQSANSPLPTQPQDGQYHREGDHDANGNLIPLELQQPHRILGFIPNFRTVPAGAAVPRPGWKYNLRVATDQSFDYSSFLLLGLTSITAEGLNFHPVLGKGLPGFYAYTWRGFIDKTDGTYLSAFLLPSLLHEDTRYYPLGAGHSIPSRTWYVITRQAVARTYDGNNTLNIAGLGGKALTQVISKYYYPPSAGDIETLSSKFGYSVMRDVGFSAIREFYPDVAAHYIRKHREKMARLRRQLQQQQP